MKKMTKILFSLVIGIFLVPYFAWAEELPTEGVHYFLSYPNGEEIVVENYEEAKNPQEKLIYTGKTNSNGEVILNGWEAEGQLRIVHKAPKGYSTDQEEYTVNLSDKKVDFIDYKGSKNPKTGQSLLFIILLIGVVGTAILVTGKGHKKGMIPALTLALLIGLVIQKVYAENGFVITVKDKEGNKLSGVEVEVYAKPNHVEGSPAIIISANGGTFYDYSTEMYFRIPNEECTMDEFVASLSIVDNNDIFENVMGAYRSGYLPNGLEIPATLRDGTEIKLQWNESPTAVGGFVDGNGGTVTIHNLVYDKIEHYKGGLGAGAILKFKKEGEYAVGLWPDTSCAGFDEHGMRNEVQSENNDSDTTYVCWNKKPDGIYVNGNRVFVGNSSSCYYQAAAESESGIYSMYDVDNQYLAFYDVLSNNITFSPLVNEEYYYTQYKYPLQMLYRNISESGSVALKEVTRSFPDKEYEDIHSMEIIENGNTVVNITEEDIEKVEAEGSTPHYEITNATAKGQLQELFQRLNTNRCVH